VVDLQSSVPGAARPVSFPCAVPGRRCGPWRVGQWWGPWWQGAWGRPGAAPRGAQDACAGPCAGLAAQLYRWSSSSVPRCSSGAPSCSHPTRNPLHRATTTLCPSCAASAGCLCSLPQPGSPFPGAAATISAGCASRPSPPSAPPDSLQTVPGRIRLHQGSPLASHPWAHRAPTSTPSSVAGEAAASTAATAIPAQEADATPPPFGPPLLHPPHSDSQLLLVLVLLLLLGVFSSWPAPCSNLPLLLRSAQSPSPLPQWGARDGGSHRTWSQGPRESRLFCA